MLYLCWAIAPSGIPRPFIADVMDPGLIRRSNCNIDISIAGNLCHFVGRQVDYGWSSQQGVARTWSPKRTTWRTSLRPRRKLIAGVGRWRGRVVMVIGIAQNAHMTWIPGRPPNGESIRFVAVLHNAIAADIADVQNTSIETD